jgi:hypothetical protein
MASPVMTSAAAPLRLVRANTLPYRRGRARPVAATPGPRRTPLPVGRAMPRDGVSDGVISSTRSERNPEYSTQGRADPNALLFICWTMRWQCTEICFFSSDRGGARTLLFSCTNVFRAPLRPIAKPCDARASRAKDASPTRTLSKLSPTLHWALAAPEAPDSICWLGMSRTSQAANSAIFATICRPSPRTKSFLPTTPRVNVVALASR